MSETAAAIDAAFKRVLRLSESMDYGSLVVQFQFRKGKVSTSKVSQEITTQHAGAHDTSPEPVILDTK